MRTHVVARLVDDASVQLVLSAPQPGLLSWARLNPLTVLVLPLLAWLAAWGVVWVVTERVVIRWLEYLDRIAAIYARGRFSVRPVQAAVAPAEIRALAQTLDAMADAIVSRDQAAKEHLAQKDALMRRDPPPGEEQPAGDHQPAEHAAARADRPRKGGRPCTTRVSASPPWL